MQRGQSVGQTVPMSPVSRGRKGRRNKKSTQRALPYVVGPPQACDCPACSGEDVDPQDLLAELADAADLVGSEDPLDAEVTGATVASIGAFVGEAFDEAMAGAIIPQLAAGASAEALAMLMAIGSVAQGPAGKAAREATDGLVATGVPRPRWAAELAEPVTVGDCWRLSDPQGTGSVLVCSFHRAGRSHAVVLSVDHLDCGAANDIMLLDTDQLPDVLQAIVRSADDHGLGVTKEALDPAEFRWQVEQALDARAVHDGEAPGPEMSEPPDGEGRPPYPAMALLMRARMRALPTPTKAPAPHGGVAGRPTSPAALLAQLVGTDGHPFGIGRDRTAVAALPAKRKKSDRPAPVYQIKVGLRGAKPPIWRRLQVPADISLARLHAVIQVAFDWDDSHLHVFETPYGKFGTADTDLGHRAEAPVTLEQVAPAVKSKIRYTYDFGDDWEHEILVEKVLDHDKTATYPRCTGGRRAAPPEDCGGIWGYAELVQILSDPTDPEHEERLEWLGLDDAADFDPARFDAAAVTRALSTLR